MTGLIPKIPGGYRKGKGNNFQRFLITVTTIYYLTAVVLTKRPCKSLKMELKCKTK